MGPTMTDAMDHADTTRFSRALNDLARGQDGVVTRVQHVGARDTIAERLEALGLVPGEPVRVVATGPFGGEPLVVQVGSTRFALRFSEARRVLLELEPARTGGG